MPKIKIIILLKFHEGEVQNNKNCKTTYQHINMFKNRKTSRRGWLSRLSGAAGWTRRSHHSRTEKKKERKEQFLSEASGQVGCIALPEVSSEASLETLREMERQSVRGKANLKEECQNYWSQVKRERYSSTLNGKNKHLSDPVSQIGIEPLR